VLVWRIRRLALRAFIGLSSRRTLPRQALSADGAVPTLFFAHYRVFMDAVVAWLVLPRDTLFVVHPFVSTSHLWFRCLAWLGGIRLVAVSSDRPFAIRVALRALRQGRPLCMFPMEQSSGQGPSPLYQGASFLLARTGARLVPMAVARREGIRLLAPAALESGDAGQSAGPASWGLKVPAAVERRNIFVAGSLGYSLSTPAPSDPAAARQSGARHAGAHRLKMIAAMLSMQASGDETLWSVAQRAGDRAGLRTPLFESHRGRAVSPVAFAHFAQDYSRLIEQVSAPGEILGLIVPNSARGAAVYLATVSIGRIAALLPHDAPAAQVVQCAREAGARSVIAFRTHVGAQLSYQTMGALEDAGVRVVYLDRPLPERRASVRALLADMPLVSGVKRDPHRPSTILFSRNGGVPGRAALHSDATLIAAASQLKLACGVRADDCVLSSLPLHDPTGLIAGVILPLISGARSVLQDHPRTRPRLPEIAHARNATLVFAAIADIAHALDDGHPCDLQGVRSVVVSGGPAGKSLQHRWLLRYGRPLLESLGSAEMGGLTAVNGWMGFSVASVGRPFPGIEVRLDEADPAGAGRLALRAPSAFLGYVNQGTLAGRQRADWIDTGQRVRITGEGHIVLIDTDERRLDPSRPAALDTKRRAESDEASAESDEVLAALYEAAPALYEGAPALYEAAPELNEVSAAVYEDADELDEVPAAACAASAELDEVPAVVYQGADELDVVPAAACAASAELDEVAAAAYEAPAEAEDQTSVDAVPRPQGPDGSLMARGEMSGDALQARQADGAAGRSRREDSGGAQRKSRVEKRRDTVS